jgi:3'(2'), 5'-bisphosphate nucleotidase
MDLSRDSLCIAIRSALLAGAAVLEVYGSEFSVADKSDGSPVTLADRRSHEMIARELSATGLPVLSEEGRNIPFEQRRNWNLFWLVDPLDGTKEFVHRRGEFTVNIALIKEYRPVLGVIFLPVANLLYAASFGRKAWKAEGNVMGRLTEWIRAPGQEAERFLAQNALALPLPRKEPRPYTIIGSRSHGTGELTLFVEEQRKLRGSIDFISAGSSLKFCRVAEGSADIYPRFGPTMEWDTAAGQAVAEAAGARVLEAQSRRPLLYNKQDLTNPWFVVTRPEQAGPLQGNGLRP